MRPTAPLIILTIGQGLAGGLLFAAGFLIPGGALSSGTPSALLGLALVGALAGGVASFFHMHRLQAAKYVLRRLKTSWLSREALSMAAFGGALAVVSLWTWLGGASGTGYAIGLWVTVALGLLAMWVTAMLYATIPAMLSWHSPITVINLMGMGIVGGSLFALWAVNPHGGWMVPVGVGEIVLLVGLSTIKVLHWQHFHQARQRVRASTGFGLPVAPYRLQDTGTTKPPYRTQRQIWPELALPTRRTLKIWTIVLLMGLPLVLVGAWMATQAAGLAAAAAGSCLGGTVLERWGFFAEATHSSRVFFADEARVPSRVAEPMGPWNVPAGRVSRSVEQ